MNVLSNIKCDEINTKLGEKKQLNITTETYFFLYLV